VACATAPAPAGTARRPSYAKRSTPPAPEVCEAIHAATGHDPDPRCVSRDGGSTPTLVVHNPPAPWPDPVHAFDLYVVPFCEHAEVRTDITPLTCTDCGATPVVVYTEDGSARLCADCDARRCGSG
jgi:hypothetical protein